MMIVAKLCMCLCYFPVAFARKGVIRTVTVPLVWVDKLVLQRVGMSQR